jgi:hypothetical protein
MEQGYTYIDHVISLCSFPFTPMVVITNVMICFGAKIKACRFHRGSNAKLNAECNVFDEKKHKNTALDSTQNSTNKLVCLIL